MAEPAPWFLQHSPETATQLLETLTPRQSADPRQQQRLTTGYLQFNQLSSPPRVAEFSPGSAGSPQQVDVFTLQEESSPNFIPPHPSSHNMLGQDEQVQGAVHSETFCLDLFLQRWEGIASGKHWQFADVMQFGHGQAIQNR